MNGRRLFREYAQSKGKEAVSFVKIEPEQYNNDTLVTRSNDGQLEQTSIDYKDMIHWVVRNKNSNKT